MIPPPEFASMSAFIARIGDVGFWRPYIAEILSRHGFADAGQRPRAGFNPTYPTFLCGDVVVKLFGHMRSWRVAHPSEHAAQALIATDSRIMAPRLLAEGRLYDHPDTPWPYLVTTRMPGIASSFAEMTPKQRLALAADLGRQVRHVHALAPSGVTKHGHWQHLDVTAAAQQSSLPPHLVAQAEDYLQQLGPVDPVFVHGDLCANHIFVDDGRLAGIIDWGDAMVADRHYEIIQVYRDMFGCDKRLLRAFLEAGDWPVGKDFARRALGFALHRQAVGLAQHHSMDVFEPIAARFPLRDLATLDELAIVLFAV